MTSACHPNVEVWPRAAFGRNPKSHSRKKRKRAKKGEGEELAASLSFWFIRF